MNSESTCREYAMDILPNGLRVISAEMPHLHSIEMQCYVGVGGRHESPLVAGVSHFLEHMLFRGTTEYPSNLHLERAFEAIGGGVNALTDPETTCFHSRLHPDALPTGAALFASMLRRPLFLDLEVERRIILEEALEEINEKGEDISPDNLTARLMWPGHPLALPTIGTRESIGRIGVADLQRHRDSYYTPAGTVIAVAGAVRHAEVLRAVADAFGDWQGTTPPPPLAAPSVMAPGPQTIWVHDSDSQVSLQLAFRLPGRQDDCGIPLRVLRRVLSGGGASRLMLRLRETLGLTYNVDANLALLADTGAFSVDLAVAPENMVPAVREILAIFDDIRRQPVDADELGRVVRSFLYDLEFSRDHPEDMAARYGWGEAVNFLRTIEEDRRDVANVSGEQLWHCASERFVPGALTLAAVGPFRGRDRKDVEKLLASYR